MKIANLRISTNKSKLHPKLVLRLVLVLPVFIFPPLRLCGQTITPVSPPSASKTIRGVVKSGNMPIPGAEVSAANVSTKEQISTSTDVDGTYLLRIPTEGRYTVRVQMAAFAAGTQEVLLDATHQEMQANFELILLSRARQVRTEPRQANANANANANARGFQNLSVFQSGQDASNSSMSDVVPSGMPVPGIASDSATESVAVSGNTSNSFNTMSADQMQQRFNDARQQGGGFGGVADLVAQQAASVEEASAARFRPSRL